MQRRNIVIFDLDGTLVDTAPDLSRAVAHVLSELGAPTPPVEAMRNWIGGGGRKMVARGLEAAGLTLAEAAFEDAVDAFLAHYRAHLFDNSALFPGVSEALTALQGSGAAMGVCTNKYEETSVQLLAALRLDGFFGGVILGGDSLPVRKPDGRHVLAVAERLGGTGGQSVMVGDSATDVAAARDAGVPVIAVSFGYSDIPAAELGADAVIDSFDELVAALEVMPPAVP
jgi:phosphoglycolate phosphatase